jgi:hypothetical protein
LKQKVTAPETKLSLPKQVETDERYEQLQSFLTQNSEKLWSGSSVLVPVAAFSDPVKAVLALARDKDRLSRGIESIERVLDNEAHGIALVDKKTGEKRVQRISRMLVMSNDGVERFYRKVESLLRQHGQRVMALRVSADAKQLGAAVFGPEKAVKLFLVEHKEDVAAILLALADQA